MSENTILKSNTNNIIGKKEKRICFLGSINLKKGIQFLIQTFHELHKYDSELTLHIGAEIQEPRLAVFLDSQLPLLKLQDSIEYYGRVSDVFEWLLNFSYIINTSVWEGHCQAILEGLAQGLSPILYSSVGIYDIYPKEWIFKDFDELIEIIKKGPQPPEKMKQFVHENYSLERQLSKIDEIISNLLDQPIEKPKKKKVSSVGCIIATKNGSKTLGKTLESLKNQTKPLKEIVIVDDGSTDDTEEVVKKALEGFPYKYVKNDKSKWVFTARNLGVNYLTTTYMFFLDSDDLVSEAYVEEMSKILDEKGSVAVVYPDMLYFNESGKEQEFKVPDFDPQTLMQRNFIAYASMQRTKTFMKIGGYSNYLNDCRNHLTEWDLWLNYMKAGYDFYHVKKPLFHYFKSSSSDQMSENYERPRQDMHLQMAFGLAASPAEIQMKDEKKRVLLVVQGQDYCDRSKVGFEVMTFCKPLEMNGEFEVYTFFYDVEMKYHGQSRMLSRFKEFVDVVKPTYVFHMTYKDHIPVEVWKEISKKYCTICWNSDDWRWEEFTKEYEKGFRYSITTYPEIYKKMDHPGKILSQWGANSFYFRYYPEDEKDIDVSFTGQKYGNREEMLSGLDVEKYGNLWGPNSFVDFVQMASILRRSKITIALSMGAGGKRQLKLRPFEATASCALCICEKMPRIEEYFEVGKEIILFDTKDELKELINYYLEHEDEREEIAYHGYQRTRNEHLLEYRLKEIFREIEK